MDSYYDSAVNVHQSNHQLLMRYTIALASRLLLIFTLAFSVAPTAPRATAAPDDAGGDAPIADARVVKLGTVDHEPIGEMSGIVKSATYDDTWWVHNDSGDSARLFAIDSDGNVIYPGWLEGDFYGETPDLTEAGQAEWPGHAILNADNVDWEDITQHDGKLYIAETGNNGNARRDLGIYVVSEPNPRASDKVRALQFIPVVYPDQEQFPAAEWTFDCESIFFDGDTLCMITKHRAAGQIGGLIRGTKLYRLDTMDPNAENELTLVDARDDLPVPTSADMSPDGRHLAVLCLLELWVFERPTDGDAWLNGAASARKLALPTDTTRQCEGVCWDDNETLRITNEQRDLFRVKLADMDDVEDE